MSSKNEIERWGAKCGFCIIGVHIVKDIRLIRFIFVRYIYLNRFREVFDK